MEDRQPKQLARRQSWRKKGNQKGKIEIREKQTVEKKGEKNEGKYKYIGKNEERRNPRGKNPLTTTRERAKAGKNDDIPKEARATTTQKQHAKTTTAEEQKAGDEEETSHYDVLLTARQRLHRGRKATCRRVESTESRGLGEEVQQADRLTKKREKKS